MVCGLPVALSVTLMVPLTVPIVVGVKVTAMTQVPPTPPPVPQELVSEKPADAAILEMVSFAPVLLVSFTVFMALVVFSAWLPKLRFVGAKTRFGATPVPVRFALCGLVAALSVTTTVPWRVPVAVGVNTTLMAQFAPAAREPPQVVVSE